MSDVIENKLDGLVLKGDPKADTLEASLDAYTKPNLVKLAELNDFDVKQSWNKDQMIEVISGGLRNSLEERFSIFEADQLKDLKEMLSAETEQVEKEVGLVAIAVNKGILYVSSSNEEVSLTMPAEFEETLEKLVEKEKTTEAKAEEPAVAPIKQVAKTRPFLSRQQRRKPVQQRIVGKKTGRNEPCPCGSGKKYKKCCWRKDQRKGALTN